MSASRPEHKQAQVVLERGFAMEADIAVRGLERHHRKERTVKFDCSGQAFTPMLSAVGQGLILRGRGMGVVLGGRIGWTA